MRAKCQRVSNTLHWSTLVLPEGTPLLKTLFPLLICASLALLQACASAPAVNAPPEVVAVGDESTKTAEPKAVPELTLHLPGPESADCNCNGQKKVPPTFLEKGFAALAAQDYREAVNYFRRHQRLDSSPAVDWEASIAVAYVKMIPDSPYYNWRAARDSYLRLMRDQPKGATLHQQIVLFKETLAILIGLHEQINDLQSESAALSEALEKREEALRRLRVLTLGQKAVPQ
ncbi:MAG: hypothetical protein R3E64_06780 [Halioglobus sp.]